MSHSLKLVILLVLSGSNFAETVYYPRPESPNDIRQEYPIELLRLAFEKADVELSLIPNPRVLPQARALLHLQKRDKMDVVWTMTSTDREKSFRPIRIPIYKGLIGWRIGLISGERALPIQVYEGLSDLKKYTVLQGTDWPDRVILESNNIKVRHTYYYENMFEMLRLQRADMFLRSVVEIWREMESHKSVDIDVEPNILVRYPAASYYFVHRNNPELADIISRGLERSLDDGSFSELFHRFLKIPLEKSRVTERQVISLRNPLLPKLTPIDQARYWYGSDLSDDP